MAELIQEALHGNRQAISQWGRIALLDAYIITLCVLVVIALGKCGAIH